MKKKVDDLNLKDGDTNAYAILKNDKIEIRTDLTSSKIESVQSKINENNQITISGISLGE